MRSVAPGPPSARHYPSSAAPAPFKLGQRPQGPAPRPDRIGYASPCDDAQHGRAIVCCGGSRVAVEVARARWRVLRGCRAATWSRAVALPATNALDFEHTRSARLAAWGPPG